MKRVTAAFALVILGAAGMAMAQSTMQSQSASPSGTPSSQSPSSTAPSSTSSSSSEHAAKKEQMKDCMAQQKANNSGMSKSDMKKYCKNQVEGSSTSSSHHQ